VVDEAGFGSSRLGCCDSCLVLVSEMDFVPILFSRCSSVPVAASAIALFFMLDLCSWRKLLCSFGQLTSYSRPASCCFVAANSVKSSPGC
jgi:hypothetical protein